jgi:hypothetical protein
VASAQAACLSGSSVPTWSGVSIPF